MYPIHRMHVAACALLFGGLLLAACDEMSATDLGGQGVAGSPEVVVNYDPRSGEHPEGIVISPRGDMFVSLTPLGQIERIAADGTRTPVLDVPLRPGRGLGVFGLEVATSGTLYAAFMSSHADRSRPDPDVDLRGVYEIAQDGGRRHIAGTEQIRFPNAMTFDPEGNLYVTDSISGSVWRIEPDGTVARWKAHRTLRGTGNVFPARFPPIGANGIAYRQDALFVAVTERRQIVRIPVLDDGSAGEPTVLVAAPELLGVDGLALDVHGDLYVANVISNRLLRVEPESGAIATVAQAGLHGPASLTFGAGRRDRRAVYVTNFDLLSPRPDPGVVRIDVGAPGFRTP